MSFPDDPALLRTPGHFAATVLGNQIPDDLQPDINNLLGFARGFYLQFFQEEHGVEISGFHADGARHVRPLEAQLRHGNDAAGRLLVSHYLTIASVLDEQSDTSDELDPDLAREEVLEAVLELLGRIVDWAEDRKLNALAKEASKTRDQFGRAILRL